MKKSYIIIFMFIFLFHSTQKLFSIIPEGLYITPKAAFAHDGSYAYNKDNGEKGYFNYMGGGFALGYSIPTINKSSPVRFEFEYLGRRVIGLTNDLQMHTLLGSVYFDINFLFINEKLTDTSYKQAMINKYPLFTIYLGLSIGGKIKDYLSNQSDVKNELILRTSETGLVFGFSGGMAFNVLPYMSIDVGYRYLLDVKAEGYHEILAGVRFKVPKL